ncbi:group II intron reverse transcriptase/maturase [Subdoligranulum sp. AF14-43]|nr:group II intron reverse transcriptase/maturase [Subdoligranulum sp. AF14-43]
MENEKAEIAKLVAKYGKVQSLMQYVNSKTLKESYLHQPKHKAVGVDEVTKEEYGEKLAENIDALLKRMKQFSYRPYPVRRAYIPKGNGKMRGLGVPSFEDKMVQGALKEILEAIYEPKFKEFSFGFRPGKSCHDAIQRVNKHIMADKVSYIVDADIKGFFDNIDHDWLIRFLEHDIADKNFIRYIKRFLIGGVMEDGKRLETDRGTVQGGLISPVLANVYLHYALDMWFDVVRAREFKGEMYMVRYADDFVCLFQYESEAQKFFRMMVERLKKFGLEIAEDKSRILPFGRYTGTKETFDFLGFTHLNGKSHWGKYCVLHRTSRKKLAQKRQNAKEWLRKQMHESIPNTIKALNRKLIGHYRYYGIYGNWLSLKKFYCYVKWELFRTKRKRDQSCWLTWEKFKKILRIYPIQWPKIYLTSAY